MSIDPEALMDMLHMGGRVQVDDLELDVDFDGVKVSAKLSGLVIEVQQSGPVPELAGGEPDDYRPRGNPGVPQSAKPGMGHKSRRKGRPV